VCVRMCVDVQAADMREQQLLKQKVEMLYNTGNVAVRSPLSLPAPLNSTRCSAPAGDADAATAIVDAQEARKLATRLLPDAA
jgi:hypothetical protein